MKIILVEIIETPENGIEYKHFYCGVLNGESKFFVAAQIEQEHISNNEEVDTKIGSIQEISSQEYEILTRLGVVLRMKTAEHELATKTQ